MPNNDVIDRRDYGKLEQQVKQLTEDVHSLKGTVEEMRDMLQQAKGGWRTMMAVSGAAGVVGAAATWVATHVKVT